jgi:hypothetical protein
MAKPEIHAKSSAKRFGGTWEDYVEIHKLMDSSKGAIADNRHRVLTHNAWFISEILERIKFTNSTPCKPDGRFYTIVNSDGKEISVREIGEQHVLEDFGMRFIPSAQDYIQEMEMKSWMNNGIGEGPTSFKKIESNKTVRFIKAD